MWQLVTADACYLSDLVVELKTSRRSGLAKFQLYLWYGIGGIVCLSSSWGFEDSMKGIILELLFGLSLQKHVCHSPLILSS